MNTVRTSFAALTVLLACGCAYQLTLIPQAGGEKGEGVANEAGRVVNITLRGKTYTGRYVYGGEPGLAFTSSIATGTAISGGAMTTATGTGFGVTTYVPGSGNGRILVHSEDGDALRCEFMYSEGSGLGLCEDNAKQLYDLIIHW